MCVSWWNACLIVGGLGSAPPAHVNQVWYNPSIWEVGRGGSKVRGHPWPNRRQPGLQEALAQAEERKEGRQEGRKDFCTVIGKD